MPWYKVEIRGTLAGANEDMTPEKLDRRQDVINRLVQELAASCLADSEMVARVRTGKVEITARVEGQGRAMALDKVMKWEMAMERMLDVEMVCEMKREGT